MSIIDFISVLLLASLLLVFWAFNKGRKLACLLKFLVLIALVSSATADDIALTNQHPVLLPMAQTEQRFQDVAAEDDVSTYSILLFLYGNYSNGTWVWGNMSA